MRYLSLFSGIEAASVAWQPLGWQCVGVAEIDPFPAAVLAHHYPGVPNLGNVTDITDEQIAALGPIDVVVGGSPCQDLSVAGKRAGLAGERSGLFHEQLRIFHAARHLCGARFLLWENVPGAFSSNRGLDFAVVVGAMAGCRIPVPEDGWGTEGVALGEHGLVEWAVLDAQWFGVAQRRRRVFALLDTGDWANRPPILLEPDSLRGDSPPSREARQGSTAGVIKGAAIGRQPHNGPQYGDAIADGSCYTLTTNEVHAVAHSVAVSLRGREGGGTAELGGEVQNCLRASGGGGDKPHVLAAMQVRRLTPVECSRLQGFPEVEKSVTIFVCSSDLQKNSALAEIRNHRSQERAYSVAANQSLPSARPAGRDSSICLLGHDWPVALHVQIDCVQRQVRINSRGRLLWSASSAAQANSSRLPMPVEDFVRLAAHTMGCLVRTMQSGRVDATEGSTSRVSGHEFAVLSASEIAGNASDAERLKSATSAFMTSITSPVQRNSPSYEQTLQTWSCFVAAAIVSFIPEQTRNGNSFALSVEAITPYLQVPWRGKIPPPDGPMYKALGNSMAVPVMRWIGEAIMKAAA